MSISLSPDVKRLSQQPYTIFNQEGHHRERIYNNDPSESVFTYKTEENGLWPHAPYPQKV